MLIQSTSSAAPAIRLTSDSAPVPVAAPQTGSAPVGLPQAAVRTPAEQQQAAQQNPSSPTEAQVQTAVDSLNKAMQQINSDIEFSIDKDTKQTVIKVVEAKTGTVIRQFPSEEALAITREIDKMQHGLLLRQKA